MRFIKNHLTFIFPMMAILLGVEFFLVFDRTTTNYEKELREGYSMFVVAREPISLTDFITLYKLNGVTPGKPTQECVVESLNSADLLDGGKARSILHHTSYGVIALPSWNVTFWRMLNIMLVFSSTCQPAANPGLKSNLPSLYITNVSYKLTIMSLEPESHES